MATLRGRVRKAVRGALRSGERRAAHRTTEARRAQGAGDAVALAYARHLDAELALATPIMRQPYLDDWWSRASPEEIGAVWEATASWAAVGEGFAQATMTHLREQLSRRYGIDVRDVQLQGRDVIALLARARGASSPAPAADARTASFVIRDTLTGTVAAQRLQVVPPPGMSRGEFAARQLLAFADRLDQQAGEPAGGRTGRFVVEAYAGGDVTVEPAMTVSGDHAVDAVRGVEEFRQQVLNGTVPAEPDAVLDALLVEEQRLSQELADHITALDFATAEGIVMHADRAAVLGERIDGIRLRIQAAEADLRGENGTHVFQQASLRARYDDAWWAEATPAESATLWRYVAGWSEGSAKLWMTAHLQDQIQARFGVALDLDADPRDVAVALTTAEGAAASSEPVLQPAAMPSPDAFPAQPNAAPPISPAASPSQGLDQDDAWGEPGDLSGTPAPTSREETPDPAETVGDTTGTENPRDTSARSEAPTAPGDSEDIGTGTSVIAAQPGGELDQPSAAAQRDPAEVALIEHDFAAGIPGWVATRPDPGPFATQQDFWDQVEAVHQAYMAWESTSPPADAGAAIEDAGWQALAAASTGGPTAGRSVADRFVRLAGISNEIAAALPASAGTQKQALRRLAGLAQTVGERLETTIAARGVFGPSPEAEMQAQQRRRELAEDALARMSDGQFSAELRNTTYTDRSEAGEVLRSTWLTALEEAADLPPAQRNVDPDARFRVGSLHGVNLYVGFNIEGTGVLVGFDELPTVPRALFTAPQLRGMSGEGVTAELEASLRRIDAAASSGLTEQVANERGTAQEEYPGEQTLLEAPAPGPEVAADGAPTPAEGSSPGPLPQDGGPPVPPVGNLQPPDRGQDHPAVPSASAAPAPQAPQASEEPQAADLAPSELPPLNSTNLTLERLTEALQSLDAADVAATLPAVFAALNDPPREETWFADVDRAVEAFTAFQTAAEQLLPQLPPAQGRAGARWWLVTLEDELGALARRSGFPYLDREDLYDRRRYAAMSDEDLRAELRHVSEDHDRFDLLAEMLERRGFDEFGAPAPGSGHGLSDAVPFDPAMAGALVRVNGLHGVVTGTVVQRSDNQWLVEGEIEGSGGPARPDQVWLADNRYGPAQVQVLQTAAEQEQAAAAAADRTDERNRDEHGQDEHGQGGAEPQRPPLDEAAADAALLAVILSAAEGPGSAFDRLGGDLHGIDESEIRWRDITAEEDLRGPFVDAVTDRRVGLAAPVNDESNFAVVFNAVFEAAMVDRQDDEVAPLCRRYFGEEAFRRGLNQAAGRAAWNLIRAHASADAAEPAQRAEAAQQTSHERPTEGEQAPSDAAEAAPSALLQERDGSSPPAPETPQQADSDLGPDPSIAQPDSLGTAHPTEQDAAPGDAPEPADGALFDIPAGPPLAATPDAVEPAEPKRPTVRILPEFDADLEALQGEWRALTDRLPWWFGIAYTTAEQVGQSTDLVARHAALLAEVLAAHDAGDRNVGALQAVADQLGAVPATEDWAQHAAALEGPLNQLVEVVPPEQDRSGFQLERHARSLQSMLIAHRDALLAPARGPAADLTSTAQPLDNVSDLLTAQYALHHAYWDLHGLVGDSDLHDEFRAAYDDLAETVDLAATETDGGPAGYINRYRLLADQAARLADLTGSEHGQVAVAAYTVWSHAVRHEAQLRAGLRSDGARLRELLIEADDPEADNALVPPSPSSGPAADPIWIEHNSQRTVVHGRITEGDAVHVLLKDGDFLRVPSRDHWKANERWSHGRRDERVRALARGLALAERPFQLHEHAPSQPADAAPEPAPAFRLPEGEPFGNWAEARTHLRPVADAISRLNRSAAWRRMISTAADARPDAQELAATFPVVRTVRSADGDELLDRLTALARHAHLLLENLHAERRTNAPLLLPQLEDLARASANFTARTLATAATENRWPMVFNGRAPEIAVFPEQAEPGDDLSAPAAPAARAEHDAGVADAGQGSLFDLDGPAGSGAAPAADPGPPAAAPAGSASEQEPGATTLAETPGDVAEAAPPAPATATGSVRGLDGYQATGRYSLTLQRYDPAPRNGASHSLHIVNPAEPGGFDGRLVELWQGSRKALITKAVTHGFLQPAPDGAAPDGAGEDTAVVVDSRTGLERVPVPDGLTDVGVTEASVSEAAPTPRFTDIEQARQHLRGGGDPRSLEGRALVGSDRDAQQAARDLAERTDLELSEDGSFLVGPAEQRDGAPWAVWHAATGTTLGIGLDDRQHALNWASRIGALAGPDGAPFDWDAPGLADRFGTVRRELRRMDADRRALQSSQDEPLPEVGELADQGIEATLVLLHHFGDTTAGFLVRECFDLIENEFPDARDPDGLSHAASAIHHLASGGPIRVDGHQLSGGDVAARLRTERDPALRRRLARALARRIPAQPPIRDHRRASFERARTTLRDGFDYGQAAADLADVWTRADAALRQLHHEVGEDRAEEQAWLQELRESYGQQVAALGALLERYAAAHTQAEQETGLPPGETTGVGAAAEASPPPDLGAADAHHQPALDAPAEPDREPAAPAAAHEDPAAPGRNGREASSVGEENPPPASDATMDDGAVNGQDPAPEAPGGGEHGGGMQQPGLVAGQDDQQQDEQGLGRAGEQVRDQGETALGDVPAESAGAAERSGGVLPEPGGDGRDGGRRPGGRSGGGGPSGGDLQPEDGPAGDSAATGREPDRAGPAAGGSGGRGEDRPADGLSTDRSDGTGGRSDSAPAGTAPSSGAGPEAEAEPDAEPNADRDVDRDEGASPAEPAGPSAPRFVPAGQDDLAPSGPVARIRANLAAVELVRVLQKERRPATVEEQQVLARWSGWGAVPAVFDTREVVDGKPGPGVKYAWARERLHELLSEDEYASARRNTINAHFTDAGMVQAIWAGLEQLGFSGGLVLEPGCGSGNFIGLAPADTTMVGVEWDPTTAAIAAALYPDATVRSESFATTRLPEASFNAVVGNVPFGKPRLRDTRYNPGRRMPIHTHFVSKSVRLVAPGGLVALITSRYTLDGTDGPALEARQKMGALADLVGAVRLPTSAHQRAAGTDVVTDLLVLRRREPGRAPSQVAWMQAPVQQIEGDDIAINEYFVNHPDMVLGELGVTGRRQGDLTVRGDRDAAPALTQALQQIIEHARDHDLLAAPTTAVDRDQVLAPDPISLDQLEGSGGRLAWTEGFISPSADGFTQMVDGIAEPYEPRMSAAEAEELRALCGLRDTTLELLAAEERNNQPEMDRLRAQLNDRYDAYAAQYGPINRVHVTPRLLKTPEGEALRAELLAAGHARLAGGTITLTGDAEQTRALRDRLTARGLATVGDDGQLKMRQTKAARAERDRLVATGLAHVEGGKLELTAQGRAIAMEAGPEAVSLTRRRPPQGGFRTDPFAVRVQGLERYSIQTQKAAKTDIFREPVMPARVPLDIADSPADALAICMDQHAQVRLDVIADLLSLDDEQQARAELGDLVFHDPALDRLVPAAEYLSGDVRLKLKQATEAAADDPALRTNVEALTAVIPEDLGPAEIEVRLGSVIVDPEHVQQFLRETLDNPRIKVSLSPSGEWKVTGKATGVLANSIWGTEDANATYLASRLLNQKAIKILREVGEGKKVVDAEATEAAQEKALELNERFGEWIWEDLDRGALIARRYNDRFNAIVLRSYDDAQLSLPGFNRNISLKWWQKAAVARMINEPSVLLAHEMGAGKTLEQIIGMMELRRLGLINKPVMCVKNHILDQVRDEFMWAYPSARVLCADSSELTGEGKRRFLARCMQENPDAVILTRTAFESINLSPDGVRDYLAFAEDFFSAHQDESESVKDEESVLLNFKEKIEAFIEGDKEKEDDEDEDEGDGKKKKKRKGIDKDPALTWEHAGFDYVVIDESQDYNNLWTPSNVEGMEIDFVRRCVDLEMKLHSTRKRFGERVTTFATGTPITNRIVQYHVLMRYLRPDRLKDAGFYSADSWLATFAVQKTRLELKGDNSWGPVSRTSDLINVADLLLDIHHFGDFKTADDIDLPRPAIVGGKPEVRVIPATGELTDYQKVLADRYAAARRNRGRKGEDTCVAVIGDGFRAGQDLRLLDPNHGPLPDIPDDPQKVDALAADILDEWKKHRDDVYLDADGNPDPVRGSLLVVFCNEGVPSERWNLYDELRDLLVKGGMPRKKIRFIHETGSDSRKKRELTADCNDGHVSVLIGSTEKMGVGTNFQRRVVGIYKMHPHWRPDYDDQEDARGRRPGNQNSEIFIRKFITEGSYDVIRAQRCEMKAAFLAHLKHRDPNVRTIEVPDEDTLGYAEVAALGAGDMRLIEKAKLDQELKSLVRGQRAHARKQNGLKMSIRQAEHGIASSQQAIVDIDRAIAQRQPTAGDAFTMTIAGIRHTKRNDAGAHLRSVLSKAIDATQRGVPRTIEIGTLGGFPIEANLDRERRPTTILLTLKGVYGGEIGLNHKTVPGGHGLITRLENRLANLETDRQWHVDRIPACHLEIERAQPLLGEPYPHQDRINEVRTRLNELKRELTTDNTKTDPEADAESTDPSPDPSSNRPGEPGPEPVGTDQQSATAATTVGGHPAESAPQPPASSPAPAASGDQATSDTPAESPAFAAVRVASAAQPRRLPDQLKTAAKKGQPGTGPDAAPSRHAPAVPEPENQR
ncbi:hypothetical protein [Actinomadura sp. NPDC048394]|uniref:hypothetical protein n=1 Tax=Actinomadura sp. NPDC048394 TaxID=3158223 RepID=UPI003410DD4D